LPHPETAAWKSVKKFQDACTTLGSLPHRIPFLIKKDESHEAEGVFQITDRPTLHATLDYLAGLERSGTSWFISQELIPAEGHVLRVVIMGRRLISYWKRPEKDGQIITTLRKGSKIDKAWRPDLQDKGRTMARQLSQKTGINVAAVDVVFDLSLQEPQPLLLEINYYFGRRGLGGSKNYYRILYKAAKEWLTENGLDPNPVVLF
jgi:ribosomal protein S6--L-glutamate ligase